MPHLELTDEERDLLAEILESSLERLEIEIERTDSHDYRESLKHRRSVMKSLRNKVTATTPVLL